MDEAGWGALSRGSPFAPARTRRLPAQRSGSARHLGLPEAVPVLAGALSDPDPLVRGHVETHANTTGRGKPISETPVMNRSEGGSFPRPWASASASPKKRRRTRSPASRASGSSPLPTRAGIPIDSAPWEFTARRTRSRRYPAARRTSRESTLPPSHPILSVPRYTASGHAVRDRVAVDAASGGELPSTSGASVALSPARMSTTVCCHTGRPFVASSATS